MLRFLLPLALVLGVATPHAPAADPAKDSIPYTVHDLALPGGSDGIAMDYVAFDPTTGYVWIPAGNTGAVDVVDTASAKVTQIPDFPTKEIEVRGQKRVIGPSSATVGTGVVYIGNRGDSSVCAFDARSFKRGNCGRLDSMPDGLAYVAATQEVWVTTPRDKSIRVLDAATLDQKARLTFDGDPEGFAVDGKRSRFYTNLEDKDRTLAIDLKTRKTVATWNPACGEAGPRGLALDAEQGFLFVACTARTEVLDVGHEGAVLSSLDTGDGVDNIDYAPATRTLYVGAAKAARLTVARVDGHGNVTLAAQVPTREGARNGVVTRDGTVYLGYSSAAKRSGLAVVAPTTR